MKWLLCLIAGIAIGIFVVIRLDVDHKLWVHVPNESASDTLTIRDTVIIRDTVRLPVEVTRYLVRIDTIRLTPVAPLDTIPEPVEVKVPIEQQMYRGNGWQAWVSGYHAALDSLTIDRSTITINHEATRWRRKHWGFSVGIGLAVDRRGNVAPALFAGFGYTF